MTTCIIKLIDEFGEIEKVIGNINTDVIKKINLLAQELELPFLSVLDDTDCNIYNYLQTKAIKNELLMIEKKYPGVKLEFQLIVNAIEEVIKKGEYIYVKIASNQKDEEITFPFQQFFDQKD